MEKFAIDNMEQLRAHIRNSIELVSDTKIHRFIPVSKLIEAIPFLPPETEQQQHEDTTEREKEVAGTSD